MSFLGLGSVGDLVGGVAGGLFKCVVPMVDEILGQIGQQNQMLEELVETPLKGIMDEIAQGAWIGDGATAFMNTVNQEFTPQVQAARVGLDEMSNSIRSAMDRMVQADSEAARLVNDLASEFENIYKG
jgi:WXG100 family type VII secretion target